MMGLSLEKNLLSICWGGRKKRSFTLLIALGFLICCLYLAISTLTIDRNTWGINSRLKGQERKMDKSGVRVIVGHYVGGSNGANLSDEIVNTNQYAAVEGAGAGGRPVLLPSRDVIRARDLFSLHGFNILVSDRVPLDRSLPDMRSQSCVSRVYPVDSLPTASVVIVFHNEAWSTLMRTVTSVLQRSPKQLLKEIILVDDASERRYLGAELEAAVSAAPGVRVLRSPARAGLVAARLLGARNATGDALLFLDAHCEVTIGWLEPLLEQAASDDVFVCPHIDLLSDETLAYVRSTDAHWGAFSRRLHFRWLAPSRRVLEQRMRHPAKPYPTPAMAGGLFAVRRSLFWRLGGYDEGMKVWGGENLELSWRAWQCGARVEIAPCSRVGHIFRKHSPYSFPGGVASVLHTNLARAAVVWMDEWADFFFKFNPNIAEMRDRQNVRERVELRARLGCKSFGWYLQTVWPQHFFPTEDRWFGRIRSAKGACLGTANVAGAPGVGGPASGGRCGGDLDLDGLLVFTPDGQVMADEGLCLEAASGRAVWRACSGTERQRWLQSGPRLKTEEGKCLTLASGDTDNNGVGSPLLTRACAETDEQVWKFERVLWR